jgi:hypothetical protein
VDRPQSAVVRERVLLTLIPPRRRRFAPRSWSTGGAAEPNRLDGIALIVDTADTGVLYHNLIAGRLS